jgi:Fe-S-cluster containining protein
MTLKLWYHEGLRFECAGCGGCCTGAPGYVWVNKAEIEAMAAALGMGPTEFRRKFVRKIGIRRSLVEHDNGECVFFNGQTRGCKLYDSRPRQCKTWPFWPSNLRSQRAWQATVDECPGCNHGPLVPLEKIQKLSAVLRV